MYVSTHTAADAYEKVLAYAGCSRSRDKLDSLIVADTRQRKATYTGRGEGDLPGIIDTPYDLKPAHADADWSPWPELKQTRHYKDADGDGMDDDDDFGSDDDDDFDGDFSEMDDDDDFADSEEDDDDSDM